MAITKFDVDSIAEWARADCESQIVIARKYTRNAKNIVLAGMWSYQFESDKNIIAVKNFLKENKDKNIIVFK